MRYYTSFQWGFSRNRGYSKRLASLFDSRIHRSVYGHGLFFVVETIHFEPKREWEKLFLYPNVVKSSDLLGLEELEELFGKLVGIDGHEHWAVGRAVGECVLPRQLVSLAGQVVAAVVGGEVAFRASHALLRLLQAYIGQVRRCLKTISNNRTKRCVYLFTR